ncbi:hypothetical protein [Undibacterium sp. TJN19]
MRIVAYRWKPADGNTLRQLKTIPLLAGNKFPAPGLPALLDWHKAVPE